MCGNERTNLGGKRRKGNKMSDEMNTFELETFLKMVLEILNGCKTIEEAREKIKALLTR